MSSNYYTPETELTDTDSLPAPRRFLSSNLWSTQYLLQVSGAMDHAMENDQEKVAEFFATSIPSASAPVNISLALAPTPIPTPPTHHIFRVSAPPMLPYDGKSSNLRTFCSQLLNLFQDQDLAFPTEMSKIRYAYQCLGPGALIRMRNHFRCLEDPTVRPEITSVSMFLEALKRECDDPGLVDKATRAVDEMRQKNITFHDFITKFQDNLAYSTYADVDKATWKKMLERRLSCKLHNVLLSSSDVPNDYYDFVAYLKQKDSRIQELQSEFPKTATPQPQPHSLPVPKFSFYSHPYTPASEFKELTVSQGGSATDLDLISREKGPKGRLTSRAKDDRRSLGRCHRCNKEGHLAINCPLGKSAGDSVSSTELKMANVPNSNYVLNPALYGNDIDIKNSEMPTKPNINGYIIWVMKIWKDNEYRDEALIEAFQEVFTEWTTEIFDVADILLLRDLRDHLRKTFRM
ncbi:hypothetical protein EPUL_006147 [Erysiphe pulchra]|uniref:CCHC-type domain-containing protein n=1 Tax=Erysiphe pulchra TaxID=225359 RepID=A0A2S4PL74_9PEZI|nr:hypothetical protein EPUL_006147 [Erysiphe pulchra]